MCKADERKHQRVVSFYGYFTPLPPRVSITKHEKSGEVLYVILKVMKLGAGERSPSKKFVERETDKFGSVNPFLCSDLVLLFSLER